MTLLAEMHRERIARLHRLGMTPQSKLKIEAAPDPTPPPPPPPAEARQWSPPPNKWSMCETVNRKVALRFGVSPFDLRGTSRAAKFIWPRHVAIFLAYRLSGKSTPWIGRFFDKDHTTVLHAVHKLSKLCETSADLNDEINYLKHTIVTGEPVITRPKRATSKEFV